MLLYFFLFNDPPTTEIYTLSLHDALPISALTLEEAAGDLAGGVHPLLDVDGEREEVRALPGLGPALRRRSEEHTSELQSQSNLVCRLLLEKKKKKIINKLKLIS